MSDQRPFPDWPGTKSLKEHAARARPLLAIAQGRLLLANSELARNQTTGDALLKLSELTESAREARAELVEAHQVYLAARDTLELAYQLFPTWTRPMAVATNAAPAVRPTQGQQK